MNKTKRKNKQNNKQDQSKNKQINIYNKQINKGWPRTVQQLAHWGVGN